MMHSQQRHDALASADFAVTRCQDWLVRGAVERDHYLHRWPDPRSLPFGYHLSVNGSVAAPDGRPWGLVVMKKLQHQRQSGLFGYEGLPTAWQVLDLARVWVHPRLQSIPVSGPSGNWLWRPEVWIGKNRKGEYVRQSPNVFSRMVSAVLRRVQADWLEHHPPVYPHLPYHVEIVVSYCETAHHDGTGYRAANFNRFGTTDDGAKEIYLRRLATPRWDWQPTQMTLILEEIAA